MGTKSGHSSAYLQGDLPKCKANTKVAAIV